MSWLGVTALSGGSGFGGFVLRLYVGELVAGLSVCVLLFGVEGCALGCCLLSVLFGF